MAFRIRQHVSTLSAIIVLNRFLFLHNFPQPEVVFKTKKKKSLLIHSKVSIEISTNFKDIFFWKGTKTENSNWKDDEGGGEGGVLKRQTERDHWKIQGKTPLGPFKSEVHSKEKRTSEKKNPEHGR